LGRGVEHRWVSVALGETFSKWAGGEAVDFAQDFTSSVGVKVGEGGLTENLADIENFEEIEFDVAQI
jgi:hypothetical protein